MQGARLLQIVALGAASCCDPTSIVDTFPVPIDLTTGVPLLGARAAELGATALRVVLDTATPVTVLDEGETDTTRRSVEVHLLRSDTLVARAAFQCVPALVTPVGAVGTGTASDVGGVIGGDLLSRVAVRISAATGEIRFFPDIAGDDSTHEDACTAVLKVTPGGGGTYIAANEAVEFPPSRLVLSACLAPDPLAGTAPSGADSLLVVATGVGPSVISRTAAKAALGLDDAAIDALPETRLYFPGDTQLFGDVAHTATLPRLALTGRVSGRGPCAELQRSRMFASCTPADAATGTCTRPTCGTDTCAAASVETGGEVPVAIVPDTHPLLQALRNELRPESADIGGLLGMSALGNVIVDLDYPHTRVLARCAPGGTSGCVSRPKVQNAERETTLRTNGCLK